MISIALLLSSLALAVGIWFAVRLLRRSLNQEWDQTAGYYGGQLVADVLQAHGVQFLFTLCGGHISPILVASERLGIRIIDVRHEASAVFAADAVSRLSGTVGVAVVTAGPGVTNTVTAVKNAQMAESPVVLLVGAAPGLMLGRGSLQDIDQLSLFKPLCKWMERVRRVSDIVPTLSRAFYEASSGTPGPVLVEFPIDTLYSYEQVMKHLRISDVPRSWRGRLVNWYLRFYLFRLFANGFEHKPTKPGQRVVGIPVRTPSIPLPIGTQVDHLARLVAKAQRPLLLVGSQAMLPPVPATETARNVKYLGIPVYLSGMSRGLLGRHHPNCFRHARRVALREADLIILAGVVCDFRLDYGRGLNRRAKIVVINRNKKQLSLNSDIFWKPYLAVCADVASTLQSLAKNLNERFPLLSGQTSRGSVEWSKELRDRESHRDAEIRASTLTEPAEKTNSLSILWQLEHHGLPQTGACSDDPENYVNGDDLGLPVRREGEQEQEECIIVADGGDFVGSAAYILRPRGPLSWLDPGPFGTLGAGGGFALGAKLCRPNATVWVIYGDGSAGFSIAEWDSLARHRAPAIAVIGNDACWSQIARDQVAIFQSAVGCSLKSLSYEKIGAAYAGAEAFDQSPECLDCEERPGEPRRGPSHRLADEELCWSRRGAFLVDKHNVAEIAGVFERAKLLSKRQLRPSVINCLIAANSFREGSISL